MLGDRYHDQVDVLVDNYTVQCKRMKSFPKCLSNLLPTTHKTDAVVFRQDGRPKVHYAIVELDLLLVLIKLSTGLRWELQDQPEHPQ